MNDHPTHPGLLIFDCDGVLVDSERLQVEIEVTYLAEIGWPLNFDEVVARFMGRTEAAMLAEIEAHLGHPPPDDWLQRWKDETQSALDARLHAVDGVREAVQAMQGLGWQTCVGSSGTPERIARSLTTTGLLDVFEGRLFSGTQVPKGKPAPDLFLHAAKTLGFEPRDCVVVEDSPYGIEAARSARMKVVAYAGGVIPADRLTDADIVIGAMSELTAAVAEVSDEVEAPS